MTGIIKTDQLQGAGSSTVTIPSGTALNVTTVSGTPTFSGASTFSGDVTLPSINGGQIGGRRNIVINGDAQCWQRATSASSTGYTSVDRWAYYAPSSLAISRSTDVPTGFQYAISVGGGGDSSGITQKIEASTCKQLVGKTITVSFYLKQTTGAGTDKIAVALSRADSEDNFGGTTSISSQTISTTSSYVRYTLTFTSLPTEVANGLQLTIKSNGSGSVVYLITGIQLEVGSQATAFEHRSFGEELQLCKRYFERMFRGGSAPSGTERTGLAAGVWYQNSQVLAHLGFSTKRAAPTVTQSETGAIGCYGSGFFRTSTDSTPFDSITHNSLRINITSFNSNGTQGNGTYVQLVTNNVSNISIDAEL